MKKFRASSKYFARWPFWAVGTCHAVHEGRVRTTVKLYTANTTKQ